MLRNISSHVPTWLRALVFYSVIAALTAGSHALSHPKTVCACVGTSDPVAYMWALSWWPHAITHGLNPFVTHYLWSPTGVNVAQAAMIPTAAIVMAPITALVGPVASYNILSIASPALAALTSYLLCRHLIRRELPAVAGGYLFGFGTYQFAALTGHLHVMLVFLFPVMVLLAMRRVDRELSRRAYMICAALLFILQVGLSTELLAAGVGIGAVLLVAARFLAPSPQRSRIDSLMLETVGAGLIALVVLSPFFYYALFSGSFPKGPVGLSDAYGLDLLNPLFPTYATWLGNHDFLTLGLSYEGSNVTEADGYLSIAIVSAFMLWLLQNAPRRPLARFVGIAAGISFLAALGSHLHIAGQQTIALPFNWVKNLPVFNFMIPSRLVLFTSLAVAIGVAAWLASPSRYAVTRWLVVIVGAVMIFPNLITPLYGVAPSNPSFFATSTYRHYLSRDETVLALPYGVSGVSMLWQVETGFYFYMPEGYVSGAVPSPFNSQLIVGQLIGDTPPPPSELWSFIRQHEVHHVVVDADDAGVWPSVLAQMGLHEQQIGGVLLYPVPPEPPTTRRASLDTTNRRRSTRSAG
jgi:hypothetical protein